jgi:hypothetical protein
MRFAPKTTVKLSGMIVHALMGVKALPSSATPKGTHQGDGRIRPAPGVLPYQA